MVSEQPGRTIKCPACGQMTAWSADGIVAGHETAGTACVAGGWKIEGWARIDEDHSDT